MGVAAEQWTGGAPVAKARVSEVLVDFKEIGIAHWGNVFIAV